MDGELRGRSIRQRLSELGHEKSGPAYYQFMARLEEAGFVAGRYEKKVIDGQVIKERVYKITGNGVRAREGFVNFAVANAGVRLQGA